MVALLQISEPGGQDRQYYQERPAIGIDLGTTHSLVSIVEDGKPVILPTKEGDNLLQSIVSYVQLSPVVGKHALEQGETIRSVKRLMGKSWEDVAADNNLSIYEPNDRIVQIKTKNKSVTPIEVSAEILKELKRQAESYLGQDVEQVVITVPAYFDEAARTATRDAAHLAGLEVLRLLNEPTAAALAYGLENKVEGIYAIYDLGGGTFDLSLLRLEKGLFQVIATAGDTVLGGDDFDLLISQQLNTTIDKARELKEKLTYAAVASIDEIALSREQLNQLIAPLVEHTLTICRQALADANMATSQINGVVLVGGSTRIPYIRQQVQNFFGHQPLTSIDPDCAVAYGAALQAHALTYGSDTLLLDVTPLSLGLETMGGLVEKIIHRNTTIPISKSQEFTTYQDGQTGMVIHVVQGERELVTQNRSLARFELQGIPAKIAGAARVKVTFTIDADGLLTVSAKEITTGTEQHIQVKPSYGLTEEELTNMLLTSFEFAQADIQTRMIQQAIIDAERLILTVESALKEDQNLLDNMAVSEIEKNIAILRENIALRSRDDIKQSCDWLEQQTKEFAQIRMNKAIKQALAGNSIDSVL